MHQPVQFFAGTRRALFCGDGDRRGGERNQHGAELHCATIVAMQIEEMVLLAPLTTFCIGGPAKYFIRIRNVEELTQSLDFARDKNLATLIFGGGSNVLVRDAGFDGLVIKIEIAGIEQEGEMLIAGAGESWDGLVARAVNDGLWGIENLSGIPGTVGAAPVQNIGAYGSEIKNTLAWVEAFDTQSGQVVRLQNTDCGFGYRTSRFKKEPGRFVVLRAVFKLNKNGAPNTSYKDLADSARSNLAEIRAKVLAVRAGKFPDLKKEGTAGSFFLNPVVSAQKAAELLEKYPNLPNFPAENGRKVSLAWLLDNVLHVKGLSVGGARLYEKQPLCIAASRTASASDVAGLAKKVAELVQDKLKIIIEPEVKIIN